MFRTDVCRHIIFYNFAIENFVIGAVFKGVHGAQIGHQKRSPKAATNNKSLASPIRDLEQSRRRLRSIGVDFAAS